jgi:hypothetical protein
VEKKRCLLEKTNYANNAKDSVTCFVRSPMFVRIARTISGLLTNQDDAMKRQKTFLKWKMREQKMNTIDIETRMYSEAEDEMSGRRIRVEQPCFDCGYEVEDLDNDYCHECLFVEGAKILDEKIELAERLVHGRPRMENHKYLQTLKLIREQFNK